MSIGPKQYLGARGRTALASAALLLAACNSLLGLDTYNKVACVEDCGASDAGSPSGGAVADGGHHTGIAGGSDSGRGGQSSGGAGALGGASQSGGSGGSGTPLGGSGILPVEAGAAGMGDGGPTGPCPGGPVPPNNWLEHWDGHSEALTLRDFNDCVAIYVDGAMAGVDTAWLSAFLDQAWQYNLKTYGALGSERLYVVLHQGTHLGGQASAEYETTHDGRNVIDAGAAAWKNGDYDLISATLSALVERTAVAGKHGAPVSGQWGAAGFAQIYEYDLLLGLGLNDAASKASDKFEPIAQTTPVPNCYWFSDFYLPVYRDHGKTKLLTQFFALLQQYYPAGSGTMPPMNWGQYIHFMSGAAGAELKTQATYAFGWNNTWEAQLSQAKTDFPAISY